MQILMIMQLWSFANKWDTKMEDLLLELRKKMINALILMETIIVEMKK